MTVVLDRDVEDFLQEQVKAGVCTNASELVNDAIRSIRQQRQKAFEITPELEAWLLAAADKPVTPLGGLCGHPGTGLNTPWISVGS